MQLNTTEELIADIRAGKMVILMDDEDRENEGDIIMAAEHCGAEHINFMARHARGLICMPMSRDRCERLGLSLMVQKNASGFGTKFTVSIEAATGVQKIQKIREDLYPIKFFMEKRQSFLEDFKSGKLANFSVFSAEQILAISKTLNFSVASFLSSSILSPDNANSYTNQSGVLSKPLEKYFLIIYDGPEIVKEMKTLFEMYNPGGSLSDFVQSSDNLPKTLQATQPPRGILYKEFYDKFNSGDRVDFLFTAQEQGYLTEKPSSSELLSPEGEEKIKALKIDEEKSAQFLRTYHKEEKARVEIRLKKLKDASYFTSLEKHAKEQAATVFGLSKVLAPLGKVLIKKMEDERDAIVSFSKELDNKIAKLEYQSDKADLCIETQVQSIESSIPPSPVENVPPSGSDPFGSTPPNPFMPGPTRTRPRASS
jgi:hypothetical protein